MTRAEKNYIIRIALIYILFAGAWIIFSDRMLLYVVSEGELLTRLQTYKGWFFVSVTGLLLCGALIRAMNFRKKTERSLQDANEKLRALIQASPLAIITSDPEGRITSWNPAAERTFGWSEREVLGCVNPIVPEEKQMEFRTYHHRALKGELITGAEVKRKRKDGALIDVSLSTSVIKGSDGVPRGVVAVLADITEQKEKEQQLQYLSLHDTLTSIYNRAYFEQEMVRLETGRHHKVGLIVCDVDGLKLYNDSLGHDVGDKLLKAAARVIKNCFRDSDVVARIGGDEFAVLVPDADSEILENACDRIREGTAAFNRENRDMYLSMSIGFAVSEEPIRMAELFKEADNNMYREKLRRGANVRNATIQILMKALTARDFHVSGQTERVEELVAGLAEEVGLPDNTIADMRLLARFHDIGIVGVPERILRKPAPLTQKERDEVRRHAEIGHRIALSSPDMVHLADWILKHHEWWDGKGYPLGLKGSEIPLECRILAIADAFDALTSPRPYRPARSRDEAVAELKSCAGKQFDPFLVDAFVQMIEDSEYQNIPMKR